MSESWSTKKIFKIFFLCFLAKLSKIQADIGILSFWVPELYVLLDEIQKTSSSSANPIQTYTFSSRKFYVTQYAGHNVILVNTGVGISNAAATTAILLQKFPSITRIIGSGVAGGVDPSLRVGDVVIPERWALYQSQIFAKETENGMKHEILDWAQPSVVGDDCGDAFDKPPCTPGVNTWNYSFIYPASVAGADPKATGIDATSEGRKKYWWFDVDEKMLSVAKSSLSSLKLSNEANENLTLGYEPSITIGGNGISGPTFVDNANYRQYCFDSFEAKALDMETAAAAHVATQFNRTFLFFRSLSDLAGADDSDENVINTFFSVAASNAVKTLTTFLQALPVENESTELPVIPNDFSPGEEIDAENPLLGVLSFYAPELQALKNVMEDSCSLTYGGRKFYRGTIGNANVVAVLTGVGISNAAMTIALMKQLYPGIERLVGGGIAGGVNPSLRVGDVVIPQYWALYQHQLFAKEVSSDLYSAPSFEYENLIGQECGGFDGIDGYFFGDGPCENATRDAYHYQFMFPRTVQTPEADSDAESATRQFWFEVDEEMLTIAQGVLEDIVLTNTGNNNVSLDYMPNVTIGGYAVSGPTFVDNADYRKWVYESFQVQALDMESAAAAHVAYQLGLPFIFFRSLSDLAGADQDSNVMTIFHDMSSRNAFIVTSAFIDALYPSTTDSSDATRVDKSSLYFLYVSNFIAFTGLLFLFY